VNIAHTEQDSDMIAKTCGCKNTKRKVTYTFVDSYHSLCRDKKDILISEIQACERLLKYTREENDKIILENEIAELKLALDLLQ
jgi:vacuolar-type H+-ATPase subunit D/Vma8